MVEKIQNLESDISRQKGEFGLFGLILREGSENRWDVVAAAHWFGEERTNDTQYLSEKLKEVLGGDELLKISRVVTMGMKDAFVEEMRRLVSVDHGLYELKDTEVSRVQIKRGFIITSKTPGRGRMSS